MRITLRICDAGEKIAKIRTRHGGIELHFTDLPLPLPLALTLALPLIDIELHCYRFPPNLFSGSAECPMLGVSAISCAHAVCTLSMCHLRVAYVSSVCCHMCVRCPSVLSLW